MATDGLTTTTSRFKPPIVPAALLRHVLVGLLQALLPLRLIVQRRLLPQAAPAAAP
jgi:hypothetical protein